VPSGLDERPDDIHIIGGRGDGLGEGGDAFAEMIEGLGQAVGLEDASRADGVLDRRARHEAMDEAVRGAHRKPRRELRQGAALCEEMKEGF